jgi:hypothetical protein
MTQFMKLLLAGTITGVVMTDLLPVDALDFG